MKKLNILVLLILSFETVSLVKRTGEESSESSHKEPTRKKHKSQKETKKSPKKVSNQNWRESGGSDSEKKESYRNRSGDQRRSSGRERNHSLDKGRDWNHSYETEDQATIDCGRIEIANYVAPKQGDDQNLGAGRIEAPNHIENRQKRTYGSRAIDLRDEDFRLLKKLNDESSVCINEPLTKIFFDRDINILGWNKITQWREKSLALIKSERDELKHRLVKAKMAFEEENKKNSPNLDQKKKLMNYAEQNAKKNLLMASLGLVIKREKDLKPNIHFIDIPHIFVSGWKRGQSFSKRPASSSQQTLSLSQKQNPFSTSLKQDSALYDKQEKDNEPSSALLTSQGAIYSDIRFLFCSQTLNLDKYKEALMQEIAAGTRSLDNDYKPLLGKVSSLVQALGEPVSGKAGPNYHFYDSEQAMFLYLTELRSMTPYFENNHNLTADLQRGKCLGIFLNVVSEYDTCLMCSLFYKLHAISRSITKNIKTCFNKDNSGKSAEAPIFFFITSNTRGRGEFYSDPDFVKVDYYLDSYFNGNTATKAMHKQKRAT